MPRKPTAVTTKYALDDSSPSHSHEGRRLYFTQNIFIFAFRTSILSMLRYPRCRDATPACYSVSKQFSRVNRVWRGADSKSNAVRRTYRPTHAASATRIVPSRPKVFSGLSRVSIIMAPPGHEFAARSGGLVERCVVAAQFSFSTEFVLAATITNRLLPTHRHDFIQQENSYYLL